MSMDIPRIDARDDDIVGYSIIAVTLGVCTGVIAMRVRTVTIVIVIASAAADIAADATTFWVNCIRSVS